jgi:hypothetical protein
MPAKQTKSPNRRAKLNLRHLLPIKGSPCPRI